MTTIAARFSTREIAADSMVSGEGFHYSASKLRKKKSSIIGAAGEWHHVLEFYKRLQNKKSLDSDCDISALELRNDGIWVNESTIIPTHIQQDFFAIGSGSSYAIAAMHLGKSPKEAVEIAALFDPSTRGPITVMTLGRSGAIKSKSHG